VGTPCLLVTGCLSLACNPRLRPCAVQRKRL